MHGSWIRTQRGRGAALGAALLAAGLGGTAAWARGPGGGCGGGPGERLERRLAGLGLPDATLDAAHAELDEARALRRDLEGERHAARERMRALLGEEQPDPAAVMAEADALGALALEARKADLRALLAIRTLLTPEQWEALRPPQRGGPPGDTGARGAGEDGPDGA